jgi:hypothetical protein
MGKERRIRILAAFVVAEGFPAGNPCRKECVERSGRDAGEFGPTRRRAAGIENDHAAQIKQQGLSR